MYLLNLTSRAAKTLETLQSKQFKQVMITILRLLKDHSPQDASPLTGYDPFWRIDTGEYRIVYRYTKTEDIIYIAIIGKRNDDEVYKKLKNLF